MAARFNEPLFVISVAARLVEMHPQTLRKYEREGLIAPSRTSGNLRLYSDRDIERLRQVKYLVEKLGLNLAGVQLALDLTRRICEARDQVASLQQQASRAPRDTIAEEMARQVQGQLEEILRLLGLYEATEASREHYRDERRNRPILE
ncbi:MAG TPA: MerR family transcriptional regulator [Thermomicrobiales bacterium]